MNAKNKIKWIYNSKNNQELAERYNVWAYVSPQCRCIKQIRLQKREIFGCWCWLVRFYTNAVFPATKPSLVTS
jgi:hypothetical protein